MAAPPLGGGRSFFTTHAPPLTIHICRSGCRGAVVVSRGNRRQPFFLEQTTLAKVETYTAILTALILPTVAIHTIEATTTLEPEGMDVATEGVRQKHTESRWQSRSGIQCTASVVGNRRQPATPFWKRPHSSAHTPCGLVPFPGRCGNIIWGAARHQHHHTKHRRVGDTQHGHGPQEHTP